jgi:hypothetical protein
MNMDDSRLIVRFQRFITEMLVEKRLGQRRPSLTDDRHTVWLARLVQLAAPPVSSAETERIKSWDATQKAA